jgi:hypothetical protein
MKKEIITILLIFLIALPVTFAADMGGLLEEKEHIIVKVWQGATPIQSALASKSSVVALKEETDKVMTKEKYPYMIEKTSIRIDKYRCDEKMQICGYWITAYRGGQEVATNSPIWISPPPYEIVVSSSYDEKSNIETVVLRESPKEAVEQVLQTYVSMQPLGKAVVGTKE